MTDNGGTAGVPIWNAGMRGRKIELYDGGHRVPCFVRWPGGGLRAPGDLAELSQVQDLLPTFVDLAGLKRPKGSDFDGVSLARLLRGAADRLADRKLVVQFSRMNAPEPKKGDAAVLWRRWRLVAGRELYDLAADPAQATDVAGRHPEVVSKLQAHYEAWWARVAPRSNDLSKITVGSNAENPTLLTPADWADVFLDQSAQVRRGERRNGAWNLEVTRAGTYEIELRRWPVEAGAPITAGLPPVRIADGEFPAGAALPIAKARLSAGAFDQSRPVAPGDTEVTFTLRLERGPARLQTWFYDDAGQEICGAYYVYVRRGLEPQKSR